LKCLAAFPHDPLCKYPRISAFAQGDASATPVFLRANGQTFMKLDANPQAEG